MKKCEFYPKRLLITILLVFGIPIAHIIAKVADIHLPSKDEIGMEQNKENPFESNDLTDPFIINHQILEAQEKEKKDKKMEDISKMKEIEKKAKKKEKKKKEKRNEH